MPAGAGRPGQPEMKVEHSDMPKASWMAVPVAALPARSRVVSGSFSPADSPWRSFGSGGIADPQHLPVNPRRGGENRRVVAPQQQRPIGPAATPSAGISAVAPMVQGSISPVPSV